MRCFHPVKDMSYLTAFAHNLTAEIARLETSSSDTAKATFISSFSHELRSPLHGVTAGIELILDSQLTSFQQELAINVAVASRTLLNTYVPLWSLHFSLADDSKRGPHLGLLENQQIDKSANQRARVC